jgi:hypothetical protein
MFLEEVQNTKYFYIEDLFFLGYNAVIVPRKSGDVMSRKIEFCSVTGLGTLYTVYSGINNILPCILYVL